MKLRIETITPAKAASYLNLGGINRPPRTSIVSAYAREMKSGNWFLTHQGIAFNETGALIDGQQRLLAVVESETPVKMLVAYGVEDTTQDAFDSGKKRIVGEQLSARHNVGNGNLTSATARGIAAICAPEFKGALTVRQTVAILRIYGQQVQKTISIVSNFKPARRGPILAAFAFCGQVEPEAMESLFEGVANERRQATRATKSLRTALTAGVSLGSASDRQAATEVIASAIMATLRGKPLKPTRADLEYFRAQQAENVESVLSIIGA